MILILHYLNKNIYEKIKSFLNLVVKSPLFWIFLMSFFGRLIYGSGIHLTKDVSTFVDDLDYISYANNILTQGIWVPDISKLYSNSHLVAPGYPLILALLFLLFGQSYSVIILFNALIGAVSVLIIYLIGKEAFNEKIGLISSVWASFYVLFYISIPRFLKEDMILFLLVLSVYFFIKETKRRRISYFLALFSLVYGFLIHVDERYLTYFPIFIFGFIFFSFESKFRYAALRSLVFTILVFMLMTPWLIRNYVVYEDRVVVITEQTARFTDKVFGYDPMLSAYGQKAEKYSKFIWNDSFASNLLKDEDIPGLKKGKRYRSLQEGVKDGRMPHKFSTIEGLGQNLIEHWRPIRVSGGYIGSGYRYGKPWSSLHNITSMLSYGLLLPFFIIGTAFIIKERNRYGVLMLSLILTNTLLHVFLLAGKERYRVPIDAFVIIISFKAIHDLLLINSNNRYLIRVDKFIKNLGGGSN